MTAADPGPSAPSPTRGRGDDPNQTSSQLAPRAPFPIRRHTRPPGARHPGPFTKAVIRAGFIGGGYLTPKLAARAAARLWCRVPPSADARRKDNRPNPGVIERPRVGTLGRVTVEWWGADGAPVVYLVHGWGGWRGHVAGFAPPLVEAGLRVVSFDALSHGDSEPGVHGPGYSSGGEMIESLKAVAEFFGPARGVIAHSLGCGVTARTILEGGLTTERLALISPNADMRELAVRFGRSLGFRARTCDLMIRDIEGWGRRIADLDVTAMGGQAPLPAPLIVHDRQDKQVPFQTSVDIEANWPGSRFVATDGLGHFRVLIDPNVIRAATTAILSDEALPTPP